MGLELVAGADEEELVDDVELELEPQPATSSAIVTSAAPTTGRPEWNFIVLIIETSAVVSVLWSARTFARSTDAHRTPNLPSRCLWPNAVPP